MIELPVFPDESWYIATIKELFTKKFKKSEHKEEHYKKVTELVDEELNRIFSPSFGNMTFEHLLVAPFAELQRMKMVLDSLGTDCFYKYKEDENGKQVRSGFRDSWDLIYKIYDKFSKYEVNTSIIKKYGINCCPYCNEHFIFNRHSAAVAQLDHFFPRGEYPIFALCLYNLVPSCSACNHIKREKLLGVSPHNHNLQFEDLKISYKPGLGDFMVEESQFDIEFKYVGNNQDEKKAWEENIDKLFLKEAYNYHKDYVVELITKYRCNSNEYIETLQKQFPDIIQSVQEAKRFVYGNYLHPNDYLKRPLSKMTHDIVEELEKSNRCIEI